MFYSPVLLQSYKTKPALKGQLTKYIKAQQQEVDEMEKSKKRGSKFYLGDNLRRRLWITKNDVRKAKKELSKL